MKTPSTFWVGLLLLCNGFLISCIKESSAPDVSNPSKEKQSLQKTNLPIDTIVYVCHSKGTKRFHLNQSCGGLNRCKHEIITMTNLEAVKIGLELCGYED